MLITLTTTTYDLDGELQLQAREDDYLGSTERRVSRTATLDVGVAVEDRGYTDGDRTLTITAPNTTLADYRRALYLQQTYPRLNVSTPDGLFLAAIERLTPDGAGLTLQMIIIQRIDQ